MSPDTAILQLTQAKGLGTVTLDRVLKRLSREGRGPEDLVMAPLDELVRDYGLRNEVAQAVKTTREEAAKLSDQLAQQKVQVLFKGSVDYPAHLIQVLGEKAPPVLFAKGNLEILQHQAVGFTGSRKTSEKGLKLAKACAAGLAREGINIISGYASGTDLVAHWGALMAGGVTTLVLVEGILNFRVKRELSEFLNQENFLVLSEFSPQTRWIARNAMQRNRTICGLSDAMILTESGLTGGTFAAGETTLKLQLPLFVVEYAHPPESAAGNTYFLNQGATGLRGDRNGHPKLDSVFQVLGKDPDPSPLAPTLPPMPEVSPVEPAVAVQPEDRPSVQTQQVTASLAEKVTAPMPSSPYPKRLIEVDLPIKRISAHARREKSIRHGHISTLHIWWARRPLAACRAVICAALWIDPVDPLCPQVFREEATRLIQQFAKKAARDKELADHCSPENWEKWQVLAKPENQLDPTKPEHLNILRYRLLDFIADFANWDNSTQPDYLETSRALTQAAHEALGGIPGSKPLVVDPFAGGGSIPLEALRVGADAFASDLNPVAVLLNKVVLEYIPKYGQRLADEVRKWGQWVKEEAEKELAEFYPKDPDGATPIAYLWARKIICEAPGCGAEVPLISSRWLSKRQAVLVDFEIQEDLKVSVKSISFGDKRDKGQGTVKMGSVTCLRCGYTMPRQQVRSQLAAKKGGGEDALLIAIVKASNRRLYRLPEERDFRSLEKSKSQLAKILGSANSTLSPIPNELLPREKSWRHNPIWIDRYGMNSWGDLHNSRQALALFTFSNLINQVSPDLPEDLRCAIKTCLALVVDRIANSSTSLCRWNSTGEKIEGLFSRQAINIMWDFSESNPFSGSTGGWDGALSWVASVCEYNYKGLPDYSGTSIQCSSTNHLLPDDCAAIILTDPPYYDAVPYASLSDFFYVWLKRMLADEYPNLFSEYLTQKDEECVVDEGKNKDKEFFRLTMTKAMQECRRIVQSSGVGLVVFANKSTDAWETQIDSMIQSGWVVTGSWPIDTEMGSRLRAMNSAALGSSIHIICRPRENLDGSLRVNDIGDWRDVLQELPQRIHDWMPRLAAEGVVGADAIFACLGPALEIFSRYSRVEKASGEQVFLKEYLENVWAAVSREALGMIFQNANTTGFEEDARLTAMWLWTLSTGESGVRSQESRVSEEDEGDDEEESSGKSAKVSGYILEFDAARKIAQGLGAHLDRLNTLVRVKGDKAILLPVRERGAALFGKAEIPTAPKGKKKTARQLSILSESGQPEDGSEDWGDLTIEMVGNTVLDRIHQSMLLFSAGRSEALKRFLVDDGIGQDQRFWQLAQALSALYPIGSDEKRWVDGVLARKKGLGF